jgi:hypothetical protein
MPSRLLFAQGITSSRAVFVPLVAESDGAMATPRPAEPFVERPVADLG